MEEGKYEYGRLLDARLAVEQKVNLYGVVTDYAYPKPTRGRNRDFFCAMTIADMSCHSPGLRVLAFGPKENLPRVKSLRDIIRFHRVKMTIHEKAPQAHYIKGSSFVLFHGARNSNDEPYQVSSNTFTFEEYDRQCLELLREWSSVELPDSVSSQYLLHIRDIKDEPTCFDLCCKVLHVDVDEPVIMYVWDGSDSSLTTSLPFVENQSLPVAALRQFPTKGTVLQVIIDMPFDDNKTLWLPQVGTWIKLRNITNRISGGILESVFTFKSKIEIPDCQLIQGIERCYEERLVSSEAGLPENCPKPVLSPTVTDYENVPYSTLREVLASPQVTYKFRCLVRVKSIRPENVGDFCCLFNGKHIYSVQLMLEDPTAQIPAYLFAEDGEKFFNGFPAALRDNDDACLGVLARLTAGIKEDEMAPKAAPTPPPPPPPPPEAPPVVETPPLEPTFTGTWFDDPVEGEAAQQAALELKDRIEIKALSVREFLETTVVPLLLQGMHHLVLERPSNPVEYLAAFLLKNNPQGPEPPPPPKEPPMEEAPLPPPTADAPPS